MPYWVYILKMKDGRFYTGMTSNLQKRLNQHVSKSGARTTSIFGMDELIYSEEFEDKKTALQREREIKGWRQEKKLALAKNFALQKASSS
jgi:putative endonuclease